MTDVTRRRLFATPDSGASEGPVSGTQPPQNDPPGPPEPPVGSTVRDTRDGRVGRVMPRLIATIIRAPGQPHVVTLRPLHGGIEWDVPLEAAELLRGPDEPEPGQ